jgi:hypothetical protein
MLPRKPYNKYMINKQSSLGLFPTIFYDPEGTMEGPSPTGILLNGDKFAVWFPRNQEWGLLFLLPQSLGLGGQLGGPALTWGGRTKADEKLSNSTKVWKVATPKNWKRWIVNLGVHELVDKESNDIKLSMVYMDGVTYTEVILEDLNEIKFNNLLPYLKKKQECPRF